MCEKILKDEFLTTPHEGTNWGKNIVIALKEYVDKKNMNWDSKKKYRTIGGNILIWFMTK